MALDPEDVNQIAEYLACNQVPDLKQTPPVDCLVLCGSAILKCAQSVFDVLETRPSLTKTLVICGGIGHSTPLLYDALLTHSKWTAWHERPEQIRDLPEARVLELIFEKYYDVPKIRDSGCRIVIEDQSTNCGANALETVRVLRTHAIPRPRSMIVVQEPTMARRTVACFEKAYQLDVDRYVEDRHSAVMPVFYSCPTFVPEVKTDSRSDKLIYAESTIQDANHGLWAMPRFLDLVMGEIPRLRDDEKGYGPKGKGFIGHVDVPEQVEQAWGRLLGVVQTNR